MSAVKSISDPFSLQDNTLNATYGEVSKFSWREIHSIIHRNRRRLSSINNASRPPAKFSAIEKDEIYRIYFLGVPEYGSLNDNTLMYVDISTSGNEIPTPFPSKWNRLVGPNSIPMNFFSKEEQLLRERKRLTSLGLTDYDVNLEDTKFIFASAGTVFTAQDFPSDPVR